MNSWALYGQMKRKESIRKRWPTSTNSITSPQNEHIGQSISTYPARPEVQFMRSPDPPRGMAGREKYGHALFRPHRPELISHGTAYFLDSTGQFVTRVIGFEPCESRVREAA
jgi:hypothetical protein